jgi:hypothetical protein
MPVRGTLRIASKEPLVLDGFTFQFETDASSGNVNKLTMEIADVPRQHWPTITHIGQDPNATIPRWPFERNKDALRFNAYEQYLINLESYPSVFGLEAIEFHRLSEEWLRDPDDEMVGMEAGFSIGEREISLVFDPLSMMTVARCIAASKTSEGDTLTMAHFRVGQMHFQNGLYVEAIRHLYFCLEHEFADGQFKRPTTIAAFSASKGLSEIANELFFANKHPQFERLRTKYESLRGATERERSTVSYSISEEAFSTQTGIDPESGIQADNIILKMKLPVL